MTPRVSLPGADELFRATGDRAAPSAEVAALEAPLAAVPPPAPAPAAEPDGRRPRAVRERREPVAADREPSGRERHDEKITVYVSAPELVDLERARLTLRAEHGVAVDRGRIVREALAVVLADLEDKGPNSILVRRLGRR